LDDILGGICYEQNEVTIIEGECPHGGADIAAREFAEAWGINVDAYPADWGTHGRAAGPIRNQQMLAEGRPEIVLAFVDKPLHESRGTNDMVTRATEARIPTYVVEAMLPDA
jgi:hypothetical protein